MATKILPNTQPLQCHNFKRFTKRFFIDFLQCKLLFLAEVIPFVRAGRVFNCYNSSAVSSERSKHSKASQQDSPLAKAAAAAESSSEAPSLDGRWSREKIMRGKGNVLQRAAERSDGRLIEQGRHWLRFPSCACQWHAATRRGRQSALVSNQTGKVPSRASSDDPINSGVVSVVTFFVDRVRQRSSRSLFFEWPRARTSD